MCLMKYSAKKEKKKKQTNKFPILLFSVHSVISSYICVVDEIGEVEEPGHNMLQEVQSL